MKENVTGHILLIVLVCAAGASTGATIVDHNCADLDAIPPAWIEAVQDDIPSHYAHTSHGSQLTWGLQFIKNADPFYDYAIGSSYLPSVSGAWCIFDGQESVTYITPDLYWESAYGMDLTRDVLDNNPTIETSMWCWCCQCDYYNESQIQAYLDSMSVLESEYPDITFIYFTGNAQNTGSSGLNRWQRNEQIRDFCITNDRILFDFADLDCWWYNPGSSSWEQHTYSYGGYDIPAEHPEFYGDEYGHATVESCVQKGEALWYMMALIAGWQGTGIAEEQSGEMGILQVSCPNPARGSISILYSTTRICTIRIGVYSCDGRLVDSRECMDVQAGTHEVTVNELGSGLYHCIVSSDEVQKTVSVVVLI